MIIEDLRLQAVSDFIGFNLENDPELIEIVELASAVTGTPYAMITFLDAEMQYLKVRKGTDEKFIPRELSFCTYAIEQDRLMTVADTLQDVRFVNHPQVTGGSAIRFFASMPLITRNGEKIGTLCVLDSVPHILDDHQQLVLKILTNQVMKIMELKAGIKMLDEKQEELREQKQLNNNANIRLRSFFESSTNFQVLLGRNGEIIDYNKTAYNFIKAVHKAKITKGDQLIKYLAPDFVATFLKMYKLALQGQKSFVDGSTNYDEMGVIYWEAAFEAARDGDDEIIGVSYLIRNVTERKLKEQKILSQNASLLKIAHIQAHEFRAPLTSIMGLMSLIKEDDYAAPKEYLQLLEQAVETLDTTIRQIVNNIDTNVIPEYTDNQ
jgi:PAS domain S-box-containing protein